MDQPTEANEGQPKAKRNRHRKKRPVGDGSIGGGLVGANHLPEEDADEDTQRSTSIGLAVGRSSKKHTVQEDDEDPDQAGHAPTAPRPPGKTIPKSSSQQQTRTRPETEETTKLPREVEQRHEWKTKKQPTPAAHDVAVEQEGQKEEAPAESGDYVFGREAPTEIVTDYKALKLNPHIVAALEQEFKFTALTPIQSHSIPAALAGRDLLAEAKTGSGKTLAFLIPIVENITRAGFKPKNGTAAVIIGPTRELCQQIEGVLLKLLKHSFGSVTFLCCIGGQSRTSEAYKLASGIMIVVASPGRLLDHLKLTKEWHTRNLLMLAVDEADRILDNGFEDDLREIVSLLPRKRQTFLFSATQTTRVEQLARISFFKPPIYISLKSKTDRATVETLEQGYVVCPSEHRLMLLYHFVKRNMSKKMIVFFSSRNAVSFHCELFNYVDVPCVAFHGKQKQHQRSATYMQFCNSPSGVLFTTDVASRGLDIPKVDWIVQFDPPDDPVKYIHRVGRTARAGRVGNALMFLLPSEQLFLKYLYQDAHVGVNEYAFDMEKLTGTVQDQLEKLVMSNYYLRTSARQAYEGYLLSYSSSQLKNVFNVQQLDLARVAKGFALTEPPPVRMDLSQSAAHLNKKAREEYRKTAESKDPRRRAASAQDRQARDTNLSGEWGNSAAADGHEKPRKMRRGE